MDMEATLHIAMLSIHSSPLGKLGTYDTGGMSVYIRELAGELGKGGHSVDIVTAVNPENLPPVIELRPNVRLVHLKPARNLQQSPSFLFESIPALFKELKRFLENCAFNYDLIHSHYWLSGVLGNLIRQQYGYPHMMTFHTIGAVKNRVLSYEREPELRLIQEKKLAEACDHIVVSSQSEKQFFIQDWHVPVHNISIVPCGVDLKLFRPIKKADARRRLNLDENNSIILFVGRFVPIKGLDRLITALGYLPEKSPWRLLLVGGDDVITPAYQSCLKKIEELNLKDRINLTGRITQEELLFFYNAADVLALPSHHESFGLVPLEALACGIPVVSTRVGATETIIKNGINGWIVNTEDPRSFAQHIEKTLTGDFSQKKIRDTVTGFTWKNAAEALLKAYEKLPRNATEDRG